ncbi:MAG TPA: carbohydrate ABC transporter permease [Anaerolineales bacterium]|nr:carbohydrate ABC transporter permease [Anaerolineales bacterium]HRF46969.1 carbohydrate ABC transporter permease [Anaerolineales bacterium]
MSYRLTRWLGNGLVYAVLTFFAIIMIFPFLVMVSTSLKEPADSYSYPPRLLPREIATVAVAGYDEPLPLYTVPTEAGPRELALVGTGTRIGVYVLPDDPTTSYERSLRDVDAAGGALNQETVLFEGVEEKLWAFEVDGRIVKGVLREQLALGEFVDPADPSAEPIQFDTRRAEPVAMLTAHPENYARVTELGGLDRSLTNTALVTLLVVIGQLVTSVLGGYAFARLRFPGRDSLFLVYLGTIMIPFVVLIIPLYRLMVMIGWVDNLAALVLPWIFTAYGTFLMRQFFITIPKELEEAALIDGASRLEILRRIFIPASVPALATQATFTFLYAWNSFIWPLIVINTANESNHVLTLSLSILRGRATDAPNLVLAGAAISVLPPLIVFLFAQRFYIESVTSSGVKG